LRALDHLDSPVHPLCLSKELESDSRDPYTIRVQDTYLDFTRPVQSDGSRLVTAACDEWPTASLAVPSNTKYQIPLAEFRRHFCFGDAVGGRRTVDDRPTLVQCIELEERAWDPGPVAVDDRQNGRTTCSVSDTSSWRCIALEILV